MAEENEPFWKLVKSSWVFVVCGSVLSGAWAVWNLFNPQIPFWVAWAILVGTLLLAVWRAGSHTHNERRELAEQLRPKLRIGVVTTTSHDHHRIMVHSLTGRTIKFRARLIETVPPINFPLPVDFQPTHCQGRDTVGEIGPYGEQPVDIFVDRGPPTDIGLKLMGQQGDPYPIPRNSSMDLRIDVYSPYEDGGRDRRWFYIIPQRDGSVILSPDGPGVSSAESVARQPDSG